MYNCKNELGEDEVFSIHMIQNLHNKINITKLYRKKTISQIKWYYSYFTLALIKWNIIIYAFIYMKIYHTMNKKAKIIFYCILGIVLIFVLCLMIWWSKHSAWEPDTSPENNQETSLRTTWNVTSDYQSIQDDIQSSEQYILDDLESFFNNSNGYENVQGDFWFIETEN